MKWPKETEGLCFSSRKVSLEEIDEPSKPLNSLITSAQRHSQIFLKKIRQFNSAFRMTSFDATKIRRENCMPTFKIQGQIYNAIGSLLPIEGSKFLQILIIDGGWSIGETPNYISTN